MHTTQVIDNYRFSVLGDPKALLYLAILYRDGPQISKEIADKAKADLHATKRKLDALFQAGMVRVLPDERWSLAEFSEEILARAGISIAVVLSLLDEQGLSEADNAFLKAYIESRSQTSPTRSRAWINRIRCSSFVSQRAEKYPASERLTYALVFGADSDYALLDEADFTRLILRWHSESGSDLWKQKGDTLSAGAPTFVKKLRTAKEDIRASNAFLLLLPHLDSLSAGAQASDDVMMLTWSRLLNALCMPNSDSTVETAARMRGRFDTAIWKSLCEYRPSIEAETYHCLHNWGRLGKGEQEGDETAAYIRDILADLIRTLGDGSVVEEVELTADRSATGDKIAQSEPKIFGELRQLDDALRRGEFDSLSDHNKGSIVNSLTGLTKNFRNRFRTSRAKL